MARITQHSFTGGEISPSLYARNNLVKYENGLRFLKNGFVRTEGCISNRAGTEVVCEVKDGTKKTRIIPFSFNTEQTYIIELGENYARFVKDGGQIIDPSTEIPAETATPYAEEDLFMLKFAQNADVLTICNIKYAPRELSRTAHHLWLLDEVVAEPEIEPPTGLSAAWSGGTGNMTTYKYIVTAVKNETYEESNRSQEASVQGHLESYWTTSEKIILTWNAVPGAVEYNVYRSANGIFGFLGTSTTTNFTDPKIEPDLTSTAPIAKNPFASNNNPSCVNYFQQRKQFGGLANSRQSLVSTQTGTENNFNISRPLSPSDAITIKLAEREVNEIRHLIGLNDLIVLTSGAEWKVNGQDGAFSASPAPMAKPQSYYGCSHVQPVVSGRMVLFVQSGGSVVRDLGYEYVSDSYDGDELTIFANHLFEGKQIVDWGYSKEPYRILWCIMSDGTMCGLTYNKKHEISGWHRHETDGEFESVAVIREGFEDVPYFVVKREINGETKRFIERMHSHLIKETSDGFFVDCGLRYDGKPIQTLYGLDYLEGKTVAVLADAGVVEDLIVKNGSISLPVAASKIVVGLPYDFEMETLPLEGENTHGLKKLISKVSIKIDKTREDFYVLGMDKSEVQNPRSKESIDDSEYLFSGNIDAYPFVDYTEQATVKIKQKHPLPITVTSISTVITIENEETDVQE
jgi:hypothetical protein